MFASEISQSLNAELVSGVDYSPSEVIKHLQSLPEYVVQAATVAGP